MILHKKIFLVCLLLISGLVGCNLPVSSISEPVSMPSPTIDPNYLSFLLSQTQTAQATPEKSETIEPSLPDMTNTPSNSSRCEYFSDLTMTLYVLDFTPKDPFLKIYLEMPGGVPGLSREIAGDQLTWEYWALLGANKSLNCGLLNFEERLYCDFSMQEDYTASTQPFKLYVNACDTPLYEQERLTLAAAKPTQKTDKNSCGNMPAAVCGQAFENWCHCTGGYYQCMGSSAVCAYPYP